MRTLTVLGASGGFPVAGQACSGFLIDWDGYRVVLDLGYGALACLLSHAPGGVVDAVVITHEHPDHRIDLHGLFRIYHYSDHRRDRLPLYAPAHVLERLAGLEPDAKPTDVCALHVLPGTYNLGPFTLNGIQLRHFVPNVGVRLDAPGYALAYTGDTGPDPCLVDLGRNVALFIVEATDRPGKTGAATRNLLTADEAGQWAARANAARLLLTHFWPGTDRHESAARGPQSALRPGADRHARSPDLTRQREHEHSRR